MAMPFSFCVSVTLLPEAMAQRPHTGSFVHSPTSPSPQTGTELGEAKGFAQGHTAQKCWSTGGFCLGPAKMTEKRQGFALGRAWKCGCP